MQDQPFKSLLTPKKPEDKVCVVVSGKMFTGKSTFVKLFKAECKKFNPMLGFCTQPIAGVLKSLVNTYFGLDANEAELLKDKLRPDYQFVGTEVMKRHYKTDIWTMLALRSPSQMLIFDDARYEDEVETIKQNSRLYCHYKIMAPDSLREARCNEKYGKDAWLTQDLIHSSETGLDNYNSEDFVIVNDGTEADLQKQAKIYADLFYAQYCEVFEIGQDEDE